MAPAVLINYTGQNQLKEGWNMVLGDKMQKSGKGSKGYSSGFVPDYQDGMETMAESECFGSSGRAEQELTASEDSCAPERKYISLNGDDCDRFGVPTQIVSLFSMPRLERRNLGVRLKSELEQVRMFQRKLSLLRSDSLVFSPTSDIHSNWNVPKRPSVESFPLTTSKVAASIGKKKLPSGRNGHHPKGRSVTARHGEIVKQSVPQNTNFDALMKQCEALLKHLMKQKNAWIFNKPVDIVELNIPDYFDIIKHPMDLGTVKIKLLSRQYSSPMEFAADVRLTFKNALTYNSPGNAVHIFAVALLKFFESRWKVIEKKIPFSTDESTPSKSSVIIEPEIGSMPPAKKRKTASADNKVNQKTDKRVMSGLEKQKLSADLEALLEELPENIVNFFKEISVNGSQVDEDEIEIDIETLNDDTLLTLRNLMDDYLKRKKKLSPCKIEIPNESGFSNTHMEPSKGNEPADEDVDTGGNNPPPISSFTSTEMDKDTVQRTSKCSSSSSSSSDSSSSSSGSDSEGSAGEADGPKDLVQASTSKATVASKVEPKNSDTNGPNDHLNGHAEPNSSSNLAGVEPSCHQEGESAPQSRQVSPDKLYRAAILRSRFADIIIKAQENNRDKGEKPDIDKLKLEREEVERWRKEEKARLQAEARALEEDRKKAEAEAAAEAKRKIELEREAARQALQKMEKTVDINEYSQFMEDLEMLTSAPDERLQSSFTEDTSPENSQNGIGSFKFQASSNPLEQLGLFIKYDDEEEGVEPQSTLGTSNDPGGEIDRPNSS